MFIVYLNKYVSNSFEDEFYFRYKERCELVYLQEGKNHKKQLLEGVLDNSEKQLLQGVLNKSC